MIHKEWFSLTIKRNAHHHHIHMRVASDKLNSVDIEPDYTEFR